MADGDGDGGSLPSVPVRPVKKKVHQPLADWDVKRLVVEMTGIEEPVLFTATADGINVVRFACPCLAHRVETDGKGNYLKSLSVRQASDLKDHVKTKQHTRCTLTVVVRRSDLVPVFTVFFLCGFNRHRC